MQTESNNEAALARVEDKYTGLVMVVSPAEAKKRIEELQGFVRSVMVKNVDYGPVPGSDKNVLLQPGAQKLCELYGFSQDFEDVETVQDWDKPLFFYRKKCVLKSRRDGTFIGAGVGSCSSRESKYSGRWVFDNEIPRGLDKKTLRSRTKTSFKTKKPYTQFRIPNEDVCDLVNTIEKMACKRSLVMATIGATRSSGLFTQDVEDMPSDFIDASFEEVPPAPPSGPSALAGAYVAEINGITTIDALEDIGTRVAGDKKAGKLTNGDLAIVRAAYGAKERSLMPETPAEAAS